MNIPNRALDLYEKAKIEIEKKQFEKALINLQKALEIYPEYAEALSLIGYAHYRLNFKKKSKKEVYELSKRALELNKTSQEAWFQMGNANSYINKFNEAIECYKKAHEFGYENEKLYNNLGSAYLKKGDLDNALKYYNEGLKYNENFSLLLNSLGYCYLKKGEFDKALHYLEKAIESDPKYSAPLTNIGNIYNEKGDYDEALKYYYKAIEIETDDSHAINNLGTVYFYLKNYGEAIKYFKRAIEIEPDYGDPWTNLGAIYSEKSEYEKAIECYDKALELDFTLFKAWYNKGNAYSKMNDLPNAVNSYKESIKINASYFPSWSNLGVIFSEIKNYSEAEKCFKKAIDINPNSIIDLFNLGNLYRYRGDFTKAIKFYQKAIQLDTNNGSAWFNQGISYLMIKDFDMAINCLEEATYLLPQNHGIWGNLGMAYEGKMDYDNAIKCFYKVLEINPNDILALNTIGQIYIKMNMAGKAIPFLKKALEIEPSSILQINNLGYEYYQGNAKNAEETQGIEIVSFPYTPDIYTSIGMAYHQLGNNKEALKYLNLAIVSDPENFIGFANLGIFYIDEFDFSGALTEINKAINLIQKKGLKQELEKVNYLKVLAESALELKPELKIVDKQIKRFYEAKKIRNLINICGEIKKTLKKIIEKTNIKRLPIITKDLLLAKFFIFESLYNLLNFIRVHFNKISDIQNLFSSKTEFIKFFFSFQNFKDIMNLIRGYNRIEEIPESVVKEILSKVPFLESLGSELSDVITGSIITTTTSGELYPLTESRIIHSGVENTDILKVALSSDKESYLKLDNLDLFYINEVFDELLREIPKYKGNKLKKSDFIEFIGQFPESLRIEVAKLLKRIKFISFEEMGLLILKEINNIVEEPKNAYIISFKNGWQKSQDAWSYFTQKLSIERFNILKIDDLKEYLSNIEKDQKYIFIFLDDVILTGSQFVDFFNEEMRDIIDDIKEIQDNVENVHFYIVSGLGSFASRNYITQKIEIFTEDSIRFGFTIRERDRAFSEQNFLDPIIKEELIRFLKKQHPLTWNGYKDSQCLVVLEWNTPDNTISCLRKNTDNWKALFHRN